ncbi:hypothetical protein EVAR_60500_1 [Eumeta japonica]|uniref:Uncharacterized protein n=1 Tax=Eumeta variegata TaxID=151549 RepID=A0A4C1ZKG5_EUMVA|nr:hypothetical protein EVAR_60500_1 [Eumeta japonica]
MGGDDYLLPGSLQTGLSLKKHDYIDCRVCAAAAAAAALAAAGAIKQPLTNGTVKAPVLNGTICNDAGNAPVTLLGMRVSVGGGEHLVFDGLPACLPHDYAIKKVCLYVGLYNRDTTDRE